MREMEQYGDNSVDKMERANSAPRAFRSISLWNKFVHYRGNNAVGSTAAEETCADAATIEPPPYHAGTR